MSSEAIDDPPLKQILDEFVRLLSEEDVVSVDAIQRIEELIKKGKLNDHNAILDTFASPSEDGE